MTVKKFVDITGIDYKTTYKAMKKAGFYQSGSKNVEYEPSTIRGAVIQFLQDRLTRLIDEWSRNKNRLEELYDFHPEILEREDEL